MSARLREPRGGDLELEAGALGSARGDAAHVAFDQQVAALERRRQHRRRDCVRTQQRPQEAAGEQRRGPRAPRDDRERGRERQQLHEARIRQRGRVREQHRAGGEGDDSRAHSGPSIPGLSLTAIDRASVPDASARTMLANCQGRGFPVYFARFQTPRRCSSFASPMPRKMLRRLLARLHDPAHDHSIRRVFGDLLHNPNLWHLNRYSVAWGVSVGLFMAFVPLPGQMVLAAAAAIVIGCNLPIAVVVVWVSNPITIPPLFYAAYKTGAWLLDWTPHRIKFELSMEWVLNELGEVWEPLLLGCLVLGILSAAIGHAAVRIIWRIHVSQSWSERKRRRELRRAAAAAKRKQDAGLDTAEPSRDQTGTDD